MPRLIAVLNRHLFLSAAALALTLSSIAQQPKRGPTARAEAAVTAPKPADAEAKPDKKEEKEPVLSVTEHKLTLGGKTVSYKATAGYMAMKDAKNEKTKANIFFVAYTKVAGEGETVDTAQRPEIGRAHV